MTEDKFIIQSIKADISAWASRAEMARNMGDPVLLQKALKHKTKYEKQLSELEKALSEAEERDRLQLESNRTENEESGCPWCSIFKGVREEPFWLERTNVTSELERCMSELPSESALALRKLLTPAGITNDQLKAMADDFALAINEVSGCDQCRTLHAEILATFRLQSLALQDKQDEL